MKQKKKSDTKLYTIEEYIQKKGLNETEFEILAFNQEVKLFAIVKELPVVTFFPYRRYQVTPSPGWESFYPNKPEWIYLYTRRQFDPVRNVYGLIGLSKNLGYKILAKGAAEIEINQVSRDIFITKLSTELDLDFEEQHLTRFKDIKGVIPKRRELARSDLFENKKIKRIVSEFQPEIDFDKWENSATYREENSEALIEFFYNAKPENVYIQSSLLDMPVIIPETYGEKGPITSMLSKSIEGYMTIEKSEFSKYARYFTDQEKQMELAVKLPPPTLSRKDLVVIDTDEDMFELPEDDSINSSYTQSDLDYETEQDHTKYETLLKFTKEQFWSTYDPEDSSTIPFKKDVINWLTNEQQISIKAAESIDLILRDGRSRPGRKPIIG